jgi:hypothetical protein
MKKSRVHLHSNTTHKRGTPYYPSPKAVHLYHMACGEVLESPSAQMGIDYVPSWKPNVEQLVTCFACQIKMHGRKRLLDRKEFIVI